MKRFGCVLRTKFTIFTFQLSAAGTYFIVKCTVFTQDQESVSTGNCIDANSGAIQELEA